MIHSSPLAPLCHLIQQVRSTATINAGIFQKNEAATRAALIDPVLRALGWDTANVRMVEPEKTINTTWRADYALHDAQGEIGMLLEAKCLGSNLEKYSTVQQLLGYAFGFGVLKVIITDGMHWHFYTEFKPGHSTAEAINLLQDDVATCALRLVQWLDATQSGHNLQATDNTEESIAPAASKATAQPPNSTSKPKAADSDFIELTGLNLADLPPDQKPKQLRLPNGTVKPVVKWKDILVEVSRLLLATNAQLSIPLPDKAKKKRFLFAWEKQPVGASTKLVYQGKPVFVGTNYSAPDCLANAIYAAQFLPANQRTVSLAIRF